MKHQLTLNRLRGVLTLKNEVFHYLINFLAAVDSALLTPESDIRYYPESA